MAFLSLDGVALAVMSCERIDPEIGDGLLRAFDGSLIRSARAYKRQWSLSSSPLGQAESTAWVQVLQGRHERWSFDTDKFSTKGLVAAADVGTTIVTSSPTPKWGAGCLNIPSGTGNGITFPVQVGVYFTLKVWRCEAGTWFWYWVTYSNGTVAVYKNGVTSATSLPAWLVLTSGSVQLTGIAGTAFQYDDLVVYPVVLPLSWQTQAYAFAQAQAAPFSPQLAISGDICPLPALVQGKPSKAHDMMAALPGAGFADNVEPLDFELWEQ